MDICTLISKLDSLERSKNNLVWKHKGQNENDRNKGNNVTSCSCLLCFCSSQYKSTKPLPYTYVTWPILGYQLNDHRPFFVCVEYQSRVYQSYMVYKTSRQKGIKILHFNKSLASFPIDYRGKIFSVNFWGHFFVRWISYSIWFIHIIARIIMFSSREYFVYNSFPQGDEI